VNDDARRLADMQVWDERLETGVGAIDLQHRVLFDLLHRLGNADDSMQTPHPVDVLEQLKTYAQYHFRYEEDWVRKHAAGQAVATSHGQLHAHFDEALCRFEGQWRQGSLTLPALQEFLRRWLIAHIIAQDLPLLRALQAAAGSGPDAQQAPSP